MNKFAQRLRCVASHMELDWPEAQARQNLNAVHRRLRAQRERVRRRRQMLLAVAAGFILVATIFGVMHWQGQSNGVMPANTSLAADDHVNSDTRDLQAMAPQGSDISQPDSSSSAIVYSNTSEQTTTGVSVSRSHSRPSVVSVVKSVKNGVPFHFADGSKATPLQSETRMVIESVSRDQVVLDLGNGAARFDVTPNRQRRFEVNAGFLTVVVLGTSFTVDRSKSGVSVSVHRGVVRAEWSNGAREIYPAQGRVVFESQTTQTADGQIPRISKSPLSIPDRDKDLEVRSAKTPSMQNGGDEIANAIVLANMKDVLAAADDARLHGQPEKAARYLQNGLRRFPYSPQAATAFFTLGRVLLEECHRPKEAADAFFNARRNRPTGPLAEDALAREVEARYRVGDHSNARRLANKYMDLYPNGARMKSVRRFGSLE